MSKRTQIDKTPLLKNDNQETFIDISQENDYDEIVKEKPLKQKDIQLWLSDAVVIVVEHLQYYAVLLSLSERWGWPLIWIDVTSFTFLFNADLWEFRKLSTNAFNHSQTSFIDSKAVGFNYAFYLGALAFILILIVVSFGGFYVHLIKRRPLHLLLYVARWKRVMFLTLQLLSLPFGIAAARVFQCHIDETLTFSIMDVQNEIQCYTVTHFSFIIIALIVFVVWFFLYPLLLSIWIRDQVFSADSIRHEGYLQLKEAEYEQGLDISWEINQYYLFSSFNRSWIFYNPLKFFFKFLLIALFAISLKTTFWSSACTSMLFSIATLTMLVQPAFRVKCFNVMLVVSHFILACNALVGNFTVMPPWEDPSIFQIVSFLRYPTNVKILQALNIAWLIALVLWVVYMTFLNHGLISHGRLWPRLAYSSSKIIGEDTKKYLKAALKGRHVLERAMSSIPLFAPIHELTHQIKVINAYCRETEYLDDPTHSTLWDLLDELIQAHNALAHVSVFGLSGKNSIKETSEEFIKLMPSFRKRLKQREYDLILVPPTKRRMLLKMYILGVFVSSIRNRRQADTKLQEAMPDGVSMSTFEGFSTSTLSLQSTGSRSVQKEAAINTMKENLRRTTVPAHFIGSSYHVSRSPSLPVTGSFHFNV